MSDEAEVENIAKPKRRRAASLVIGGTVLASLLVVATVAVARTGDGRSRRRLVVADQAASVATTTSDATTTTAPPDTSTSETTAPTDTTPPSETTTPTIATTPTTSALIPTTIELGPDQASQTITVVVGSPIILALPPTRYADGTTVPWKAPIIDPGGDPGALQELSAAVSPDGSATGSYAVVAAGDTAIDVQENGTCPSPDMAPNIGCAFPWYTVSIHAVNG